MWVKGKGPPTYSDFGLFGCAGACACPPPARNASQREVGGLLSRRRSRWVGFASGEAGGNQAGARDAGPGLGNILIGHKRSNKLFQSLILTLFHIVREATKKKSTNPRP